MASKKIHEYFVKSYKDPAIKNQSQVKKTNSADEFYENCLNKQLKAADSDSALNNQSDDFIETYDDEKHDAEHEVNLI